LYEAAQQDRVVDRIFSRFLVIGHCARGSSSSDISRALRLRECFSHQGLLVHVRSYTEVMERSIVMMCYPSISVSSHEGDSPFAQCGY
jgi:hypothetical protein